MLNVKPFAQRPDIPVQEEQPSPVASHCSSRKIFLATLSPTLVGPFPVPHTRITSASSDNGQLCGVTLYAGER